jgi:hypothetical protein
MDISGFNVRDYAAAVIVLTVWLAAMIILRFTLDNWLMGVIGGSIIGMLNAWWMSRWYWSETTQDSTSA